MQQNEYASTYACFAPLMGFVRSEVMCKCVQNEYASTYFCFAPINVIVFEKKHDI